MSEKEIKIQIKKTERLLMRLRRQLSRGSQTRKQAEKKRLSDIWIAPSSLLSLRSKLPKNPVAWQRNIRAQWNRREKV